MRPTGPTAPTELRELLEHDVARSIFHIVREYLEDRGSGRGHGQRQRDVLKQAAEATELGLLQLNGGAQKSAELKHRFGCSQATIDRRRRLLRDALREASR